MFTRTALKIASRELRAAPTKFLLVILAVAVGVAALSGIKGFGAAFKSTLLRNARQLIAADVQAQIWNFPSPAELAKVQQVAREHRAELTRVTETVSMAGSTQQHAPQLVSVKAVDPAVYPFYGKFTLNPPQPLAALLANDRSIVVTPELLIRLKVHRGDDIRLGGQNFTITGILVAEPDRLASGFGPGMRVLMTRAALDRTGLVQFGSRAAQRFLFRLRPETDLDAFKAELKGSLRRVFISDYREGSPVVGQAIDNTTTFLSLISLIALIVGSLGVGTSIHSHLQQRLDTIGIMKAIGARSGQVMQIYVLQTLCLGFAGAVLGVAIGAVIQRFFPVLLQQIFSQLPPVIPDWTFVLQGLALGVLATLLFTISPLLSIRNIRPTLVFRREMSETGSAARNWKNRWAQVCAFAGAIAGFTAIAAWLSGSWRMGLYFTGGLAVSVAVLYAVAAILLWLLRRFISRAGFTVPSAVRHGVANLYRPGNHAASILVALGIGVMFTLTTFLLQRTVLQDITAEGPGREGNLFLLDIRNSSGVTRLVEGQPGISGKLELVGYIVARMLSDNGIPVGQLPLSKERKDQAETVRITSAAELPDSLHVEKGGWWKAGEHAPMLAISEEAKRDFHLKYGDRLRFQIAGREVDAPVAAEFRREARAPVRYDLVFPREALAGMPVVYYGAVHADPAHIPDIEETIFEHYPAVTVMNLADILKRIQDAVDQVAVVIRFLAFFTVLAGIIILSASVAGTRYRRVREIAILKTLGATRGRVRTIFSIEFTILGLVAGVIGGVLANSFTKVIATRFVETTFSFDYGSIFTCMLLTAVLANAAGWVASARILGQKPLEVLRGE